MKAPRAWILAAVLGAVVGCSNGNWNSGDRVLVTKLQYESGLKQPSRFDVVVFKYPKGPIENNTPKNYIKRLMGLPGEILAIFFGRLFRFAPPQGPPPPFQDDADPKVDGKQLWQREFMHENQEPGRELFKEGRFEIIRKTPSIMLALRRIVYDNDFPAKDMKDFPRWASAKGTAWLPDKQNGFSHTGAKGEQVEWLRYSHLVRPKEGPIAGNRDLKPELITDFLGYNSFETTDRRGFVHDHTPARNWVGDLMLECQVEATKAEGELWLELSKGINRFQARWDLGTGMCKLFKIETREVEEGGKKTFQPSAPVELDSKPTKLRGPGSFLVRFANIDARLTVWVDRELPFGDGKDYPPPEVRHGSDDKDLDIVTLKQRRGPTRNDLEPASIGVLGAAVHVSHIRLWRDTYYSLVANQSDVAPTDWSDPDQWHVFHNMDFKTLYVQPGHYLCLGDNSQASSDGREWGLVPERLMLGRALLVYYPFHRAGVIR